MKHFADTGSWMARNMYWLLIAGSVMKILSLCTRQETSLRRLITLVSLTVMAFVLMVNRIPGPEQQLSDLQELAIALIPVGLFLLSFGALVISLIFLVLPRSEASVVGNRGGQGGGSLASVCTNLFLCVLAGTLTARNLKTLRPSAENVASIMMTRQEETRTAIEAIERLPLEPDAPVATSPPLPPIDPGPIEIHPPQPFPHSSREFMSGSLDLGECEVWGTSMRELALQTHSARPDDPRLFHNAVRAIASTGDLDRAYRYMADHSNRFAGQAAWEIERAWLFGQSGEIAASAALYEAQFSRGGAGDEDLQDYVNILMKNDKSARALATLNRRLAGRPTPQLRRWQACLQAALGQYDSALATLRQLAKVKPFDQISAWKWGEIALQARRPAEALAAAGLLKKNGFNTPRTRQIFAAAGGNPQPEKNPATSLAAQLARAAAAPASSGSSAGPSQQTGSPPAARPVADGSPGRSVR